MLQLAKAIFVTGLFASFSMAQTPPAPGEGNEALLKKLDRILERLEVVEARLDAMAAQAERAVGDATKTSGTIYYLKNIDVNTLRPHLRMLRDLSGSEELVFTVDQRTNSISFATTPNNFRETQAVLAEWIEKVDLAAPDNAETQPHKTTIGVPDEKELERRWRRLKELQMNPPGDIAPPGKRGAERVEHEAELLPHDL